MRKIQTTEAVKAHAGSIRNFHFSKGNVSEITFTTVSDIHLDYSENKNFSSALTVSMENCYNLSHKTQKRKDFYVRL